MNLHRRFPNKEESLVLTTCVFSPNRFPDIWVFTVYGCKCAAELIDGKAIAQQVREEIREQVEQLKASTGQVLGSTLSSGRKGKHALKPTYHSLRISLIHLINPIDVVILLT